MLAAVLQHKIAAPSIILRLFAASCFLTPGGRRKDRYYEIHMVGYEPRRASEMQIRLWDGNNLDQTCSLHASIEEGR
jgi:hypothetical protein